MSLYVCKGGHTFKSQLAADNCARCRKSRTGAPAAQAKTICVLCDTNGVIHLAKPGPRPKHWLFVGVGPERQVRRALGVLARHGYEKGVLLVPGVPEADSLEHAERAAARFAVELQRRVPDLAPAAHIDLVLVRERMTNPFTIRLSGGVLCTVNDAADRKRMVQGFDLAECAVAMQMDGVQKDVRRAIERRSNALYGAPAA